MSPLCWEALPLLVTSRQNKLPTAETDLFLEICNGSCRVSGEDTTVTVTTPYVLNRSGCLGRGSFLIHILRDTVACMFVIRFKNL
jgi:hypothetical protein